MKQTIFDDLDPRRFVISGIWETSKVYADGRSVEFVFSEPHTWTWGPDADKFILRHLGYHIMLKCGITEKVANYLRSPFCVTYLIGLPEGDFSFIFRSRAFLLSLTDSFLDYTIIQDVNVDDCI